MKKFLNSLGKQGQFCSVKRVHTVDGKMEFTVETNGDTDHFSQLTAEEQEIVLNWIYYNVLPAKKMLDGHTSYGMKRVLDNRTNIYLTNNQFKEAMLLCGFFPSEPDELNWHFCIRKSSPIFKRQVDGKEGLPMMGDPMDYSKLQKSDAESASEGLKVIDLD